MTVTIVGTPKAAQTATLNPTVSMGTVQANDTLFALVVQAAIQQFPGKPTDTRGDAFTFLGDMSLPGAAISGDLFYCARAAGGTTTLTLPTTATSLSVCAELSGVAAPTLVAGPRGSAFDAKTVPFVDLVNVQSQPACDTSLQVLAPNGGLVVALIAHIAPATYTFQASGWTHLGAGSSLGLAFDAWALSATAPGTYPAIWQVTGGTNGIVLGVVFPAA